LDDIKHPVEGVARDYMWTEKSSRDERLLL